MQRTQSKCTTQLLFLFLTRIKHNRIYQNLFVRHKYAANSTNMKDISVMSYVLFIPKLSTIKPNFDQLVRGKTELSLSSVYRKYFKTIFL